MYALFLGSFKFKRTDEDFGFWWNLPGNGLKAVLIPPNFLVRGSLKILGALVQRAKKVVSLIQSIYLVLT